MTKDAPRNSMSKTDKGYTAKLDPGDRVSLTKFTTGDDDRELLRDNSRNIITVDLQPVFVDRTAFCSSQNLDKDTLYTKIRP
jgi:hypothetical protein